MKWSQVLKLQLNHNTNGKKRENPNSKTNREQPEMNKTQIGWRYEGAETYRSSRLMLWRITTTITANPPENKAFRERIWGETKTTEEERWVGGFRNSHRANNREKLGGSDWECALKLERRTFWARKHGKKKKKKKKDGRQRKKNDREKNQWN